MVNARKRVVFFLIIWSVLLAGCIDANSPGGNNIPNLIGEDDFPPEDFGEVSEGSQSDDGWEWPEYIPADIPELKEEIRNVLVAPESHIRMFYKNISEDQIEDYLVELDEAGFNLEFIVYVQEGFPDDSDERIRKGEFDAVDITKGEYHMNLSYGGGTATYDIDITGFETWYVAPPSPKWPAELADIPAPERCELTDVIDFGMYDLSYVISCKYEDDKAFDDYVNTLKEYGFYKDPHHTSIDESMMITLTDGAIAVTVEEMFYSNLSLTIERQQRETPDLEWPQELEGLIPQPDRCEVIRILPGEVLIIECKTADENMLRDYIDVLGELGFEMEDEFDDLNGEILSVSLTKGEISVVLLPISTEGIMLQIVLGE